MQQSFELYAAVAVVLMFYLSVLMISSGDYLEEEADFTRIFEARIIQSHVQIIQIKKEYQKHLINCEAPTTASESLL